jgi:hypothetical protein
MGYYLIVSASIFLLLGIIWSKNDAQNLAIKILFYSMSIFGILLTLNHFGYIIKK